MPPVLQLLREVKLQLLCEEKPMLQLLREVKRRCCNCCAGVAAVASELQLLREATLALCPAVLHLRASCLACSASADVC